MIPYFRRDSLRLKGYDYSQPGDYFVTISAKNRTCVFGEVANGIMELSPPSILVENCWKEIPKHFPNTTVDTVQIMPNHLHGIVTIRQQKPVATAESQPAMPNYRPVQQMRPCKNLSSFQHVVPNSLSSIIRSFKAAVTNQAHYKKLLKRKTFWHRSFYDHIIRKDVAHFFIARYIMLNPLYWHLDSENPSLVCHSLSAFKNALKENAWFTDDELDYLIKYEIEFREYRASPTH